MTGPIRYSGKLLGRAIEMTYSFHQSDSQGNLKINIQASRSTFQEL